MAAQLTYKNALNITKQNKQNKTQDALPPGMLLANGRYRLGAPLGSGANATTYRATDTSESGGAAVAVKALSLRGLRDWKQLELFQREASVLSSLSHPSIPRYIDYFESDSASDRAFYIVQAQVPGGRSLGELLSGGGRAPDEAEVLRIATELLGVLKYLGGLRPPVTHRGELCCCGVVFVCFGRWRTCFL
jgi:serine/threonine protein kinase